MKIAIVAPEVFPVPPIRGGAVETGIEEHSSNLIEHDVHIFGIADSELPLFEKRGHRTYHRFQRTLFDKLLLSSWRLPFKQSHSKWYYWPYCQWVVKKVKEIQPDLIRVHSRIQFVPWLRAAAPEAKIILCIHNESNLEGERVWSREAIEACDVITGCSQMMTEEIVKRHPFCVGRTRILYNGVNIESFQPYWNRTREREALRKENGFSEGPIILYVGRLVEEKGVHLLIEAFERVHPAVPNAKLLIVGSRTFSDERPTPYIESLRKKAEGFEKYIHFIGHVSHKDISRYYLMSDIVAFPSLWREPFGLVVVEAMASGLPVVAFDQGGPAEIIQNGKDGILVPKEKGLEGFTEALMQLIKNPALREKIGREARQTAESRFTWKEVAKNFLALCEALKSPEVTEKELLHTCS